MKKNLVQRQDHLNKQTKPLGYIASRVVVKMAINTFNDYYCSMVKCAKYLS